MGDAGLARWAALRNGAAASVVQGRSSAVVGTWGYTDPQYMQFGSYGPGSDVYSLGAVMLQLLTARPMLDPGAADGQSGWRCAARALHAAMLACRYLCMGCKKQGVAPAADIKRSYQLPPPPADLVSLVKRAVRAQGQQQLAGLLDASAGPWPAEQAAAFASLALRCVEYERADRADLRSEVIPELQRLQAQAQERS